MEVVSAFESGVSIPGAKGRWAWLKLLLDAKNGDDVYYGAPITLPPFLDESQHTNFDTSSGTITVDGMNLIDYTNNEINKPIQSRVYFPYRNMTPTTYVLNGQQYIDGTRPRDLPDFRVASIDFAPLIWSGLGAVPFTLCGKAFTGGITGIIDRYGKIYGEFFLGLQGSCLGYVSAGEGYVDRNPSSLSWDQSDIPDENQIHETIVGICGNVQGQIIGGLSASLCLNGSASITAFYTPGIGGSLFDSMGFVTPWERPDLAWDYIDRIPGINEPEVLQQIISNDK